MATPEESIEQQREWAKMFAPKSFRDHVAYDPSEAYEWGDPKNPAYIDWLMDDADYLRKEARGE
jgi:hypothetical protein